MSLRMLAALALAGTVVPCGASAAQTPAAPVASAEPCELHIWPGNASVALVQSMGLRSSRREAAPKAASVQDPLAPDRQLQLLATLDPASFGLPDARAIPHREVLNRTDANRQVRHSDSKAPCQAELLILGFIFERQKGSQRSLRLSATFRRFESEHAEPDWVFSAYSAAPLTIYPARKAAQVEAANADLARAFIAAVGALQFLKKRRASVRLEGSDACFRIEFICGGLQRSAGAGADRGLRRPHLSG